MPKPYLAPLFAQNYFREACERFLRGTTGSDNDTFWIGP